MSAYEERPWSEMPGSGRALSAAGLARVLKRFGVRPRNMRDIEGVGKGYALTDVRPVFDRYLPAAPPPDALQALLREIQRL